MSSAVYKYSYNKNRIGSCDNPYSVGGAGLKIADVLVSKPIESRLIQRVNYK